MCVCVCVCVHVCLGVGVYVLGCGRRQGILVYNMLYVSRYAEHVHVETQVMYSCAHTYSHTNIFTYTHTHFGLQFYLN